MTWRVSLKAFGWVSNSIKSGLWGLRGGRIPPPHQTDLEWARCARSHHPELSWPFAPVHWLKMTQCLTRPYDHIVSCMLRYHTQTHIAHPQCSRCLFSPIQCLSPRVHVPTSMEFSKGNLLCMEAILMITNKVQKKYQSIHFGSKVYGLKSAIHRRWATIREPQLFRLDKQSSTIIRRPWIEEERVNNKY